MCVPCGSALGATWDPELVERVGVMLGEEALTKACRVLLAPTVNLHRSPLGGRNFECYSEDPLLSGKTAAAFVRGVQSQGVVTTVKHFAGNDAEFERHSINSVIDARTLRELYLVPFELAVREGGALGIMTAYNRLNGPYCSEHHQLITEILRDEWGFEGFVLTDWLSAGSTVGSSAAGLDLEMPGPGAFYGKLLGDAVRAGDVAEAELDEHVDAPAAGVRPRRRARRRSRRGRARRSTVPSTAPSRARRRPRRRCCCATTAILPFDVADDAHAGGARTERRAAADHGRRLGQPRAALRDQPARRAARQRSATRSTCASSAASTSTAPPRRCYAPFAIDYFAGPDPSGEPVVGTGATATASSCVVDPLPAGVDAGNFSYRATATYVPDETGTHTFSLVQMGGPGAGPRSTARSCSTASPTRPDPAPSSSGSRSAEARGAGRAGGRARRSRSWSSSP